MGEGEIEKEREREEEIEITSDCYHAWLCSEILFQVHVTTSSFCV